jgi:hypothetical protein
MFYLNASPMTKSLLFSFFIMVFLCNKTAVAQDKYEVAKDVGSSLLAFSDNYMIMATAHGNNIKISRRSGDIGFSEDSNSTLEYPHAKVFDLRVINDYAEKVPAVVALYADGTIVQWRILDRTPVKQVKVEIQPKNSSYHGDPDFFLTPDGKWAVVWSNDNDKIVVADMENEQIVKTMDKADLQSVSLSPDKSVMYVATTFNPVEKIDFKTGNVLQKFESKAIKKGKSNWISSGTTLTNDGKYLATLGWYRGKDNKETHFIEIFETSSGKSVCVHDDRIPSRVLPVFTPDGEKFAIEKSNGGLLDTSIRGTTSGKEIKVLERGSYALQFVQEGKGLVTHLNGKYVTLWVDKKGF